MPGPETAIPSLGVVKQPLRNDLQRTITQVSNAVVFDGKKKITIETDEYKVTGYKMVEGSFRIDIKRNKSDVEENIRKKASAAGLFDNIKPKSQVEEMYGAEPK